MINTNIKNASYVVLENKNGVSNTRSDSPQASQRLEDGSMLGELGYCIDWITLSYRMPTFNLREKIDFMFGWLEDEVDWCVDKPMKVGGLWFEHSVRTIRAGRICWSESEGWCKVLVSLTGTVLSYSKPENLSRVLKYMHRYYKNCSRFDVAMDTSRDYLNKLRLEARISWENELNSGFINYGRVDTGKKAKELMVTHYWGCRDSSNYIRIYDKENYSRFEVEMKREKSAAIYLYLIDRLQSETMELIIKDLFFVGIGNICFYKESKDKNLERNELADFWVEFLEMITFSKVRLVVKRKIKDIQSAIKWLQKSVAPTLAMVRLYLGNSASQFLEELYMNGKHRMTNAQFVKLGQAIKELLDNHDMLMEI